MQQPQNIQNLRIALLDSWLQSAAEGSGTAVAIGGLGRELQRQGHYVERIAPPATGIWAWLPLTLRRLIFNLALPLRLNTAAYDLVIGFDWDGVFLGIRDWGRGAGGERESGRKTRKQILNRKRPKGIRIQTPYVCPIKGIIAEELQHERGRIRWLFTLLAKLEAANARSARRVITTSEYGRRKIVEHYGVLPERIGLVPEGIDLEAWNVGHGTKEQATQSKIQNPKSKTQNILCVARQYPRKHVHDLLQAFALIHQRTPSARLRIVGDGPEHANLVALAHRFGIAAKITFTGSVGDELLKREYRQCDLFCLPSVQEGFGIVFLEAMAAGKPVVSTTAAAIPEVVQHGKTGILVPPGDVHALAGALLLLSTDSQRREDYGKAGRERVKQYAWPHVAATFLQEVATIM